MSAYFPAAALVPFRLFALQRPLCFARCNRLAGNTHRAIYNRGERGTRKWRDDEQPKLLNAHPLQIDQHGTRIVSR